MFLDQFPAGFRFQNNFLETPFFFSVSTFQILFLWATGEKEEKNGTYYKSNHGGSATIEKPRMTADCDYTKVWEDLCVVEALG